MTISISPADLSQLDPIITIMAEAFDPTYGEAWSRSQCASFFNNRSNQALLAHLDGVAAGFAFTRQIIDEAELLLVAVRPIFHRQGIGQQLIEQVIKQAINDGAVRLLLEMREHNLALHLYQKTGFEIIGRRPSYYRGQYGHAYDAISLHKQLVNI
jgi:[ribosomal protein S18]-alanine N-acetyltransferase